MQIPHCLGRAPSATASSCAAVSAASASAGRCKAARASPRAYAIVSRFASLWWQRLAVLSQKMCREYEQYRQNKRDIVRNRRQFSWLCYGSELAGAANLCGEALLLMNAATLNRGQIFMTIGANHEGKFHCGPRVSRAACPATAVVRLRPRERGRPQLTTRRWNALTPRIEKITTVALRPSSTQPMASVGRVWPLRGGTIA
jgi:hypothetical protein